MRRVVDRLVAVPWVDSRGLALGGLVAVILLVGLALAPGAGVDAAAPVGPAANQGSDLAAVAPSPASISAGGATTCVVRSDGSAGCWGDNSHGEAAVPAGTFSAIGVGSQHACGLKTDGTVTCWGDNSAGQSTPPTGTFTAISVGGFHTCGLQNSGAVACWGDNVYGQATAPSNASFSTISAGWEHTCGVTTSNAVDCWGYNGYGQLSPGLGLIFTAASAGGFHTCGLGYYIINSISRLTMGLDQSPDQSPAYSVSCWGAGSDPTKTGTDPNYGQAIAPIGSYVAIISGYLHTCAIDTNNSVSCWGAGRTNTGTYPNYGQAIPPAGSFSSISAGEWHTCGITTGNGAVCWGSNSNGQVQPYFTSASPPTATSGSPYSYTFTTSYMSPAPTFRLSSGTLPSGLSLSATGVLSGTPTQSGSFSGLAVTADNGFAPAASTSFSLTVNQAPSITSPSSAQFSVGSEGFFTVTTRGSPTPALTETGALPGGVVFVDNGDGTARLSGVPLSGTGGAYPITITASNGITPNASQAFTLTVSESTSITSATSATFTVGTVGTFTVTTLGYPRPALTETGPLPGGVTFHDNSDGTATLSGTPAGATGGVYGLTITASGPSGTTSQTFTLTVDQAPAITSDSSTTFIAGTSTTFILRTTGYPTPSLAEAGALPAGVTFHDDGTGIATLDGTPATGTSGTFRLTISASNGVSPDASQSFTLTVSPTCQTTPTIVAPGSGVWTVVANLCIARENLAAALGSDGRIYALGGDAFEPAYSTTAQAYDPRTNSWAYVAPMLVARTGAGAAAANGGVYVVGGAQGLTYLNDVERYDPAANAWSTAKPLPEGRYLVAATTGADGRIYVLGGDVYGPNGAILTASTIAEAYDSATNSWSSLPPLLVARSDAAAATASDGRIFVFGGTPDGNVALSAVEVYDPRIGKWASAKNMPTARMGLAAALGADGRIYVVGGTGSNGILLNTVEAYDPATDSWTCSSGDTAASCASSTLAPLSVARGNLAAAAGLDGRVYAVGGINTSDAGITGATDVYVPPPGVPPVLQDLRINGGATTTTSPAVQLSTVVSDAGGPVVTALAFQENAVDAVRGQWTAAPTTYIDYHAAQPSDPWALGATPGMHFVYAFAQDYAHDASNLVGRLVNYLPPSAHVAQGEQHDFAYQLQANDALDATLTSTTGDADLYLWWLDAPGGAKLVAQSTLGVGQVDQIQYAAPQAGLYLVQVYGYFDADYQLTIAINNQDVTRAPVTAAQVIDRLPSIPRSPSSSRPARSSHQVFLPVVIR